MIMKPNVFFEFYEIFNTRFSKELEDLNISILSDFCKNKEVISEFYRLYIESNKPKIVICGINPGRFGAGKTGIPFLDFYSLSKIFPNMNGIPKEKPEKSANFIFSIIEQFGINNFFKQFYLTNISCIGFYNKKTKQNVNYYALPLKIQLFLFENFSKEINYIEPKIIIPLGKEVEKNLINDLKHEQIINTEIGTCLPHPSTKYAKKDDYIKLLEHYLYEYR